ncbi:MAG: carbohydrate kinase [Elusimicrobiota bacterium]
MNDTFPRFVSLGEALTDLIRQKDDTWLARAGGAPWNVARVMASFGVKSAFAGAVSRDNFGDELAALSAGAGLDARFLQRYAKPPLLAVVHETNPPQYYFIGADSADLAFDPAQLPSGWLKAAEWVHCGGIALAREPLAAHLAALLEAAKAAGIKISFDPNFRDLMGPAYDATFERVARLADLIKVSDEDLRGIFRADDAPGALARLKAMNPAAAILLTLGPAGAELHAGGEIYRQTCPKVQVVDTIGAGDAGAGGLLYSLMTNPKAGWEVHLRRSVATGTAACAHAGAAPPALAEVEKFITAMEGKK